MEYNPKVVFIMRSLSVENGTDQSRPIVCCLPPGFYYIKLINVTIATAQGQETDSITKRHCAKPNCFLKRENLLTVDIDRSIGLTVVMLAGTV